MSAAKDRAAKAIMGGESKAFVLNVWNAVRGVIYGGVENGAGAAYDVGGRYYDASLHGIGNGR